MNKQKNSQFKHNGVISNSGVSMQNGANGKVKCVFFNKGNIRYDNFYET